MATSPMRRPAASPEAQASRRREPRLPRGGQGRRFSVSWATPEPAQCAHIETQPVLGPRAPSVGHEALLCMCGCVGCGLPMVQELAESRCQRRLGERRCPDGSRRDPALPVKDPMQDASHRRLPLALLAARQRSTLSARGIHRQRGAALRA